MKIRRFEIWNFRSLEDITAGALSDAAVFHGENNTGKSNILAALKFIFQGKVIREEELPREVSAPPAPRPTPFYYGELTDFRDNFRWGSSGPIRFNIRLEASDKELESVPDLDRALESVRSGPGHSNWIIITGLIDRSGDDGRMQLEEAKLNGAILYKWEESGSPSYFPSLADSLSPDERQEAAEALLLSLTDLVVVVESDRYLTQEPSEGPGQLSSSTFKRWLHRLSLSRDEFPVYRRITQAFQDAPFGFGHVWFAEDSRELEIMILDSSSQRLPIARLGTGVQQVLMLLARILQSPAKVIAIEELELNLSYKNQDLVLNKLVDLVRDQSYPLSQLLITTHSDHLGSRDDVKRYRVLLEDTKTKVRTFTRSDRTELFPRSRGRRRPKFR
ncbi:MAG: AAA family ATPase [Dehalococcoidia bacterium]